MKRLRTVLLTAFSSLILATPALAAPPQEHHQSADAPCDADGPFDGVYDPVAYLPGQNYFPDDEQALPDDGEQAAPDADDGDESADDPDEDADSDEDAAPDGEGCAQIMVAPYDIMIRPAEKPALPVVWRREHPVVQKPQII